MASSTVVSQSGRYVTKTRTATKTVPIQETYTAVRDVIQFSQGASIYGMPMVEGSGVRMVVGVPIWYGEDNGDYSFDFAVSLGKPLNPNTTRLIIRRMWFDGELVLDRSGSFNLDYNSSNRRVDFQAYAATEDKPVPSVIAEGANDVNIPAFRGQHVLAFRRLNLKTFGLTTLPTVQVEFYEGTSYNPLYKDFEIPSNLVDAPEDVMTTDYATINAPKKEIYQVYRMSNGSSPRIVAWDVETGKVKRDIICRFYGRTIPIKNLGGLYFHPQMDRILAEARIIQDKSSSLDLYANYLIINPYTGSIDDIVGHAPTVSGLETYIDWTKSPQAGDVPDWEPRVSAIGISSVYHGTKGYPNTFPHWENEYSTANGPPNFIAGPSTGVSLNATFCTDPTLPNPFVTLQILTMDLMGDGAWEPYEREIAYFGLYQGRPYHQAVAYNVGMLLIEVGGEKKWTCFKYDILDVEGDSGSAFTHGACSMTWFDKSSGIVGGIGSITYFINHDISVETDLRGLTQFSVDLLLSADEPYNYVSFGDSSKTFRVDHSEFSSPYRGTSAAYRLSLSAPTGSGPSWFEYATSIGGMIESQDEKASFYNKPRTLTVQPLYQGDAADTEHPLIALQDEVTEHLTVHPINGFYQGLGQGGFVEGSPYSPDYTYTDIGTITSEDTGEQTQLPAGIHPGYGYLGVFFQKMKIDAVSGGTPTPLRRIRLFNTETGTPLSQLLTDLSVAVGFDLDDIVIEGIDDTYWGANITATTDFWQLVNDLGLLYSFEVFESQGKIKFVKSKVDQETPIDFELTDADLAPIQAQEFGAQSDNDPSVQVIRESKSNLPSIVKLNFIDYNDMYRQSQVYARRQNMSDLEEVSGQEYEMTIPVCMSIDEATKRASGVLFDAWNNRVSYTIRLPRNHMLVEPGDMLSYSGLSSIYEYDDNGELTIISELTDITLKVLSCTLNADWSTTVNASSYYKSVVPESVVVPPSTDEENKLGQNPQIQPYFMNIPLLSPDDVIEEVDGDNLSILVDTTVLSNDPKRFKGTALYLMTEQDSELVGTVPALPKAGYTTSILPGTTCPYSISEDTLTLTMGVEITPDVIPVPTYDEFLSGTYLIAVRNAQGKWDILSYREVTVTGATVTLTGLIRGRRGTEDACMLDIAPGSPAVFLDGYHTYQMLRSTTEWKQRYTLASRPPRASDEEILTDTGFFTARRHMPFAPCHIQLTRSGDDINVSWVRRSRGVSTLNNGEPIEPPFVKELRSYVVTIFKDATTEVAIQKTVVDSESVTITAQEFIDAEIDGKDRYMVAVSQLPSKTALTSGTPSLLRFYDVV